MSGTGISMTNGVSFSCETVTTGGSVELVGATMHCCFHCIWHCCWAFPVTVAYVRFMSFSTLGGMPSLSPSTSTLGTSAIATGIGSSGATLGGAWLMCMTGGFVRVAFFG